MFTDKWVPTSRRKIVSHHSYVRTRSSIECDRATRDGPQSTMGEVILSREKLHDVSRLETQSQQRRGTPAERKPYHAARYENRI